MSGAEICLREDETLNALHSGVWPHDLREHVAGCEACNELAAVAGLLLDAASPVTLPSAGFLWWKGQLQAQREQAERAQRPMAVAEACGVGGVVAGLLLLSGTAWALVVVAGLAVGAPLVWYLRRA